MRNYIKNFNSFISESVESNTKEIQLLDQKKALQEKLKQTEDSIVKTDVEKQISMLDIEIDKLRETEVQAELNDV
tara:strand:+ start:652 stop:876 length:225 start_codon:yes stop_codon:yes gene_type:complete